MGLFLILIAMLFIGFLITSAATVIAWASAQISAIDVEPYVVGGSVLMVIAILVYLVLRPPHRR